MNKQCGIERRYRRLVLQRFSFKLVLLLQLLLVIASSYAYASEETNLKNVEAPLDVLASNQLEQQEPNHLRKSTTAESEVTTISSLNAPTGDPKHGAICVYQGSTCARHNQGDPGKFTGCNSEVLDGICMNFPAAGVIFHCEAENEVVTFPCGNCEAKRGVNQPVACIDVSVNSYFLLCCAEAYRGELCIAPQPTNGQGMSPQKSLVEALVS